MARNRRNQSAANRFGPAIKALLLCLLFGGFGIGYVWQKEQINRLCDQIKEREIRLGKLASDNKQRLQILASMRTMSFLQTKIKEMKLELVEPDPSQVWRLPEPIAPVARETESRYAARETRVAATQ